MQPLLPFADNARLRLESITPVFFTSFPQAVCLDTQYVSAQYFQVILLAARINSKFFHLISLYWLILVLMSWFYYLYLIFLRFLLSFTSFHVFTHTLTALIYTSQTKLKTQLRTCKKKQRIQKNRKKSSNKKF